MRKPKLQFKIQKYLTAAVLIFVATPVLAAEVSFGTKTQEIKVNQAFEVGFFLNTENEDINAIEGKVVFSESLLELKEIKDGNSIVNFWIERPIAANGEISFSGIIPGGYFDKKGLVFSLAFQPIRAGRGSIETLDTKVLVNDGLGTQAPLTSKSFEFRILDSENAAKTESLVSDENLPEEFMPQIAADQAIFKGKWFLVFAAQDKDSGIDRYEIQESRGEENENWIEAESPYLLRDQKLKSYIYVKAIDRAGNERIAMIKPERRTNWYENWLIGGIIIMVIGYILWRMERKK